MTHSMNRFKVLSASILAISLTACSTAPQNSVVATDLSGSLSQMWSSVFTGELRAAPQPSYRFGGQPSLRGQYTFGAQDAGFNTPHLGQMTSQRAAYQPHNLGGASQGQAPQVLGSMNAFPQHFVPQARIEPRAVQMQKPAQNYANSFVDYRPQAIDTPFKSEPLRAEASLSQQRQHSKRSFGSRVLSIFGGSRNEGFSKDIRGYEDIQPQQTRPYLEPQVIQPHAIQTQEMQPQTQPLATRPAQSQPVIASPSLMRDAYPLPAAATVTEPFAVASIPPRASIDDNLAKTGRGTAAVSQDWQAASQEIGDSLSYVKMGGGSKISEWQDCEKQAGGYFIATPTGFIVDPKFDVCMRGFGYKPEAEAEAMLSVQAPESLLQRKTKTQIAQSREIDTSAIPTSRRYPSRERRGG